jgi:hypothetical protein
LFAYLDTGKPALGDFDQIVGVAEVLPGSSDAQVLKEHLFLYVERAFVVRFARHSVIRSALKHAHLGGDDGRRMTSAIFVATSHDKMLKWLRALELEDPAIQNL